MRDENKTKEQLVRELNEARHEIGKLQSREINMRESEAKVRAILEVMPDLMFRLSIDGRHLEFYAPRIDQLFVQPNEFLGQSVDDVLPQYVANIYKVHIQRCLKEGQKQVFEYYLDFEGRGRFHYEATMVATKEDEVLVLVHDITKRKMVEIELSRSEEILALKNRIISTVSHEFRTPLAIINTSHDLLTLYRDKLSEERKKQLFQQIRQQVLALTGLIDDMLSVNRAQSGKTEFHPALIDINAFCQTILDQLKFMNTLGHEFKFTSNFPDNPVMVDSKLLQHMLTNILSNAVKYSPAESLICFDLSHHNSQLIISISDEGIGIPEIDQDYLFDPFHRASNVGETTGTGMGLAIVREYAALHGGSIEVESEVGKGSTFILSLPIV